jgi:hypothetical protein
MSREPHRGAHTVLNVGTRPLTPRHRPARCSSATLSTGSARRAVQRPPAAQPSGQVRWGDDPHHLAALDYQDPVRPAVVEFAERAVHPRLRRHHHLVTRGTMWSRTRRVGHYFPRERTAVRAWRQLKARQSRSDRLISAHRPAISRRSDGRRHCQVGRPVSVTWWHQPAGVSPGREPHSGPGRAPSAPAGGQSNPSHRPCQARPPRRSRSSGGRSPCCGDVWFRR